MSGPSRNTRSARRAEEDIPLNPVTDDSDPSASESSTSSASNPESSDPMTSNPATSDSGTSNPVISDPATSDSATSNLAISDSATSGPVTSEAMPSEAMTSEATTSEAKTSEATTSEATTSEATTSEAKTSEAKTSEATTSMPEPSSREQVQSRFQQAFYWLRGPPAKTEDPESPVTNLDEADEQETIDPESSESHEEVDTIDPESSLSFGDVDGIHPDSSGLQVSSVSSEVYSAVEEPISDKSSENLPEAIKSEDTQKLAAVDSKSIEISISKDKLSLPNLSDSRKPSDSYLDPAPRTVAFKINKSRSSLGGTSGISSRKQDDVEIEMEPLEIDGLQNILLNLPSKQTEEPETALANVAVVAMRAKMWRRKSVRRRKTIHAHDVRDPEELLKDDDFIDAPSPIQAANIRGVYTTLHQKKQFMERLHREGSRSRQHPGCCKRIGWSMSIAWSQFKHKASEFRHSLELWTSHIKKIEGRFGTGVTSYFKFLRSLFYLNLPVMFLLVCFLTVPQILYRFFQQVPPGYEINGRFNGTEILTGGGWLADTELYYGYHHDGEIIVVGNMRYDMRYAYLCTMGAYYLLTVVLLAGFLSRSYRHHYIEESNTTQNFMTKVFCGWNHKISNEELATMHHNMLYKELQEYLMTYYKETDKTPCHQMAGLIMLRILANVFVLGFLGGAGYLVWYISVTQSLTNEYGILSDLAMPLCISAINIIVPFIFSIISNYERYESQRVELVLTMLRTIMLNLVTLGVLAYFWYNSVDCRNTDGADADDDDDEVQDGKQCRPCWENFMGAQLYILVIVDFIFTLLITLFSEFIQRVMVQYICKNGETPGFNIARNTLNLIYSQILVWLGVFYAPLLSLIHVIKLILIFYIKRVSVVQNCTPPSKPWRAGQTSTFIQFLLFVAYMTTFVAVAYGLVFVAPSETCGPYQQHNTTYQVLEELLDRWQATDSGNVVKSIIEIVTSIAFLAFIIIGMAVAAYYCQVVSHAHNENVKKLHNQIVLEGRDKKFLLKLLHQAQGQPQTDPGTRRISTSIRHQQGKRKTTETKKPLPVPEISDVDIYNQSYVDRSLDRPDTYTPESQTSVLQTPQGKPPDNRRTTPSNITLEAQNPAYREDSPTHLPDLPYPTLKYEV